MKPQTLNVNLDFIGISASLLCAIHCAGLPFLLTLAPLAGLKLLKHPIVEYCIIGFTLIIAISALRKGYLKYHRKMTAIIMVCIGFSLIVFGHTMGSELVEIVLFSIGGVTIAAAHYINWKLIHRSNNKHPVCVNKK